MANTGHSSNNKTKLQTPSNKRARKKRLKNKHKTPVIQKQHEATKRKKRSNQRPNKKRNSIYLKRKRQQKFVRFSLEISSSILIACIFIWVLSLFLFTFSKVDGYSMLPTLSENDFVYINRRARIKRFSIAYFKTPDQHGKAMRRIIGLPGETVEYKGDKLFVNNEEVMESFIDNQEVKKMQSMDTFFTEDFDTKTIKNGQLIIPKDSYLVLGDNRPYSTDSRYYGFVPKENIIGVVKVRILPIHKIENLNR
ncbi:signal peptidase I [Enterococcus crotali]|uniref:signal peptidase I n=1 Tax=Enterococcus crotali TaxID=1453587 RepID=UPI0004715287|nr:signal peptidase I [Enterococcus crotali]OTP53696.1 signal peptidase I [Enterococcus termitis]